MTFTDALFDELTKVAVEVQEAPPLWKRPVSGILGRAMSPLMAALLRDDAFIKKGPKAKDIQKVLKAYKGSHVPKDLKIYLNHTPYVDSLRRMWKNKKLPTSSKIIGTITSPMSAFSVAATRADHFNDVTNSISLYTNHPAVTAHELGHANDYNHPRNKSIGKNYGLLYALHGDTIRQEMAASHEALARLKKAKMSTPRNTRFLRAALGTYVGGEAGGMLLDYELPKHKAKQHFKALGYIGRRGDLPLSSKKRMK